MKQLNIVLFKFVYIRKDLKLHKYIFIILFFCCINSLYSTHNRSGEITYEQIGPLTIRATITTYTKASSTSADRDSLLLNWGDGTSQMVSRSNNNGELIPGEDIKVNYYIAEHTYPGRTTYTLSFEDPNRVNNIVNVNFPNSVDVPFFVSTTFTLVNTQFNGFNNSVILLQPPIDFACANRRFVHNPNAYDIDGDSLSYELVVPFESENTEVPSYQFPDEVTPGPMNQISLDPITGDFIWDSPQQVGEYNIAIKINEFRNGILLNSVIRDMQIRVENCLSEPPTIETVDEICVIAGELIDIPIFVNDNDEGERVKIVATGGPFLQDISPATVTNDNDFFDPELEARFVWQTTCEHISETSYQVVFRAQDNSINNETGLSFLKTIKIKVLGPPPLNLTSEIQNGTNRIEWESPYACENALNDYFIGFSVWRKVNSNQFIQDTCQGGLEGNGYEIINFLTNDKENGKYFYLDEDLEKGKTYCYRVLALFALRTISNNPFNITESLPSEESCIQLQQDIPLLTQISVSNTSENAGSMDVAWIQPIVPDFDTIENAGPYRYELYRSDDNINFELLPDATVNTLFFNEDADFTYLDSNLNTAENMYYYRVDFFSNNTFYSSSPISSSVFINVFSTDNQIDLSWQEETSWQNYNYRVFRKESQSALFEEIGTTEEMLFTDLDVDNDLEYCYFIESEGTYGLNTISDILFNFSQENCGIPLDTVGPCTPELMVTNPCTENNDGVTNEEQFNLLTWTRSDIICDDSSDIEFYNIYYTDNVNEGIELIDQVLFRATTYQHIPDEGINGCYKLSAVDTLGNEGPLSDFICVDNCPTYILPNTYTPNDDGSNDILTPIENKFVGAVDFQLFTKWGNKIFETNDPQINWTGQDDNGNLMDNGVYYYTCRIFDFGNEGELNQVDYISGYIQLLR